RIVASENQTKIRIGNGNTILLDKGKFYEFQLTSDKPSLIESDHPVLLAQYMVSNVVDRPPGVSQSDWDGDPLMLIVSPVDQTREAVTFVAYDSPNIVRKFFVNIVTKYTSMNDILLDGMPVTFEYLNGTDYSIAQVPITKGNHNLNSTKAGSGFIAYVYGYGGVESYGYGVGFNLSIKLDLGGDIHFVSDTLLLCKGEAKILDGGSAFSKFRWSTGDTTRTIFVTKPGYVSLTASNAEGCEITDSIYNYVSAPEVHLGNDTTLCKPATILLDAGKGFIGYKWSTGDSIQKITVKQAGYYSVLTTDKYDCPARDTLWTGFVDKPKPDLSHLDTLVCGKKTALFNLSADKGLYSLSSTDNSIKIDQLTATVPAYGSYPFRFNMVDQYQCKSDTAFRVAFRKIPTVTISVDDTTCYGYNLEARYLGDATIDKSRFTWVFAKDTLTDEIGKILMKIKLGMDRSKRDLFLKVTEDGCSNQNAIKEISVIPDLDFSVADSLQCQPKTFHFLATNTETVVDYLWNWGDGSTEHNGNQAVHNYAQDGHYTVELTATTDKHCENTVRKANVLYVAPVPTVDFSIKENSCLPKGIQNLFYTGSADSRDHYYWDISAFQPNEITNNPGDSKGPFSFRFIDNPIRKIGLQVISKYGCVSENKSLILRRIPNFSFASSDSAGCIPFSPELKAVPLDKLDKLSYHWNFGNGTSDNGTNVTPTFPLPDKLYDLTLTAASTLTGCSDSLRETGYFTIYPQPTAGFSVDKTLLSNESPTIQLTNTSDGAEQYRWDFADGYISRLKDPVHTFKVVGPRRIHLDAINTFGCVDTTSTEVQIALGKIFTPNAFSPNAQNQEDRIFFPYCNGVIEQGYHLRILSRWNDLVFETSNQLKGWTGKMPDGSNAPAGNYVWLLNFTDFLGVLHKQSGTVTLLY
ncbi:MAG: PKD domain-containing protein, partial [Marinilabiliales bacterium]|nr:PKD domain-containing protein [Marinilabiliales bacterium]